MKSRFLICLLLLACVFCGCVSGAQIQNYNNGVAAFERREFGSAKVCFEAAGDYANSRSYLSAIEEYERIYTEALAAFESRDYYSARSAFSSITEFGNAGEFVAFIDRLQAKYEEGKTAFEAGDYVKANGLFIQAMGYADSEELIERISKFEDTYQLAMSFYMEGKYDSALAMFEKLGAPYKDSEEKIASIYELFSRKGITSQIFRTLFNASCESEGEQYSLPITAAGDTGFAWRTTNGLLIVGNTDTEGYIETISFWAEKSLQKELGEEGERRLFAHCIHALTSDDTTYAEILADLDSFLEGAREHGGFSLMLDEDASGAVVLTADFGK